MVAGDLGSTILSFGGYFVLGFIAAAILVYGFTKKLYLALGIGVVVGVLFFYGAGSYIHFLAQVKQVPQPEESRQLEPTTYVMVNALRHSFQQ